MRVDGLRARREADGDRRLLLRLGVGRAGHGDDGGTGGRRLEQIATSEHEVSYFGRSAMNSSTARLKASGWSRLPKWPAGESSTQRACGSFGAIQRMGPRDASSSPQIRSVGAEMAGS